MTQQNADSVACALCGCALTLQVVRGIHKEWRDDQGQSLCRAPEATWHVPSEQNDGSSR